MARVDYWDSTGGTSSYWSDDNSATTSGTSYTWTNAATANTYYHVVYRKILVQQPANWSKEDVLDFVRLVNIKTKTGWNVEMLIEGNILITDPNIEVRKMNAFIPLFKQRAGEKDLETINKFYEDHPLDED